MVNRIRALGAWGIRSCQHLGQSGLLLFEILTKLIPCRGLIHQLHIVGALSLSIIMVSALFIGAVLGLQGYYTLSQFGAAEALGQLLALSVLRELGPVVTALLFAGRACSALTSEIGLMKATEQLTALQMMGIDPVRRVVVPRFLAGIIALPLLTIIFNAVAILGGYWIGSVWLGVSGGPFWGNMQTSVSFSGDVLNGIIKSAVFGVVVTWIAMQQGYACTPTSAGIAKATTKTVVFGSLAILGLDFFLTAIMFK